MARSMTWLGRRLALSLCIRSRSEGTLASSGTGVKARNSGEFHYSTSGGGKEFWRIPLQGFEAFAMAQFEQAAFGAFGSASDAGSATVMDQAM